MEKKNKKTHPPDRVLPNTALPDEPTRRREREQDADRGSHGMTGGAGRSAGHELER
jgi:hypothetical protein